MDREWKIRAGAPYTVIWQAPSRVAVGGEPVLTVRLSAVDAALDDITLNLARLRANTTVRVCESMAALHLTRAAGAAPEIVSTPGGRAFLLGTIDPERGGEVEPVSPVALAGRRLALQSPLGDEWYQQSGQIDWNLWAGTLSDAALVNIPRRSIPATLSYTQDTDGGPVLVSTTDLLLHVVRRPFETGCTEHHLYELIEGLSQMAPDTQVGFQPQIRATHRELVTHLRDKGIVEDLVNGGDLVDVHAHLAAANVLMGHAALGADRIEVARAHIARAEHLLNARLKRVGWYDADGDGAVDAGEAGRQMSGPRGGVSYRGGRATSERQFKVGGPR